MGKCASDRPHVPHQGQKTYELQSDAGAVERVSRAKRQSIQQTTKHTRQSTCRMAREGTQERMVYLTFVSSCAEDRFSGGLRASIVDRRATVEACRTSFGSRGEAASECRKAHTETAHTRDTAQHSDAW